MADLEFGIFTGQMQAYSEADDDTKGIIIIFDFESRKTET
jgi:hypothetical protein